MQPEQTYPVRVDAELDPGLTRWMWLVKWFLAIPHYFVLVFLAIGFAVVTVIAFFAILFTGRYPRSLFDFNVGVLRWQWRVLYYATSVLGTDRYPPFTLADVPDYPARLQIDYPEQLSRGLVLIKWWLLAIPHYLLVGAVTGSGAMYWSARDGKKDMWQWDQVHNQWQGSGIDLVGLLVLFAAIGLLFTGRYPRGLFDLIVGIQRWILRVTAYATLMTDRYPPFRLDQGGTENGATDRVSEPAPAPLAGTSAGL